MKHILLLASLLLCTGVYASENPAAADLEPNYQPMGVDNNGRKWIGGEGFHCGKKFDFENISRRPAKVSRCTLQFSEDSLVFNDDYVIKKDSVTRIWRTDLQGGSGWAFRYFFIRHQTENGVVTSAVHVAHETWQAIFWNQLNLWYSS